MDKKQEEKFESFLIAECGSSEKGAFYSGLFRKAWQACLDANGIEEKQQDQTETPKLDLVSDILEVLRDIAKQLKPEVVNVEAKEWKPKEGDAVFTQDIHGDVIVCRIVSIDKGMYELDWFGKSSSLTSKCAIGLIKPFNPSAIGKPWSEI